MNAFSSRELVRLTRTGGITGDTTQVTVSASGRVRITRRSGRRTTRLTAEELARLRCALQAAKLDRLPSQDQPPSPDMFEYVLAVRGRRVRLVDVPLSSVAVLTLVGFLAQLADEQDGMPRAVELPPCPQR